MKFEDFEKIRDIAPEMVLDEHSLSSLVAMQVYVHVGMHRTCRSAIWDQDTGHILWQPENALALAWRHGGGEVVMIKEKERQLCESSNSLLNSQGIYDYIWERYSWPEKQLLSTCSVTLPMGQPSQIFLSPSQDVAAIKWYDQCESGLELVQITPAEDRQLLEVRFPMVTNLSTDPVFHPNGHALVLCWQERWEWWQSEDQMDQDMPIQAGTYQVGTAGLFDWEQPLFTETAIFFQIEETWGIPEDEDALLRDPLFLDNGHLEITLPHGIQKVIALLPLSDSSTSTR